MNAPRGTVIGFACAPNKTVSDGVGYHSVYTKHLLRHLTKRDLDIDFMLRHVGRGVQEETGGKQQPYHNSSLTNASSCLFSHLKGLGKKIKARRVALVIGISAYPSSPLANPVNDARAVHDALKTMGVEVFCATDCDYDELIEVADLFLDALQPLDVAIVFISGHGCEYNNCDYLMTTSEPKSDRHIPFTSYNLHTLLDDIQRKNTSMNILLLDCCHEFTGMARSSR